MKKFLLLTEIFFSNADASIGNITGSNSVNVFLGLGLPWTIAATYYLVNGEPFVVPAGDLGFSVGYSLIL